MPTENELLGSIRFTFSGKIFCKETHQGIGDLIVSLFDIDPSRTDDVTSGLTNGGGTVPRVGLDRLGSVITGSGGKFKLNFSKFEFGDDNQEEAKPDILITVQAPAEPLSGGTGFGRLLYWGVLYQPFSQAGWNSARSESITIAIPQSVLEPAGVLNEIDNFRAELNALANIRSKSDIFISRGFSQFSEAERNSPYYLQPGRDILISQMLERDQDQIDAINSQGLIHPKTSLLSPQLLEHLRASSGSGEINSKFFIDEIRQKIGSGLLLPAPQPAKNCSLKSQKNKSLEFLSEDLHEEAIATASNEEPSTMRTSEPEFPDYSELYNISEELDGELVDWVRAQLGTAGTPETTLKYGVYKKGENPESVFNLRLKSGPADVTSYHDFDHLKLAFKHIWTEAFNADLKDFVERRFEETVAPIEEARYITGNYKFDIYAPGSVNFGLILTYRQSWEPKDYQAGQLLKTLTLTPGESKEFIQKTSIEKSNIEKSIDETQNTSKKDSSDSNNIIRDAIERVKNSNSFQANASGSVSVGVFNGSASTQVGIDAAKESEDTKKSIRERSKTAVQENISKINKEIQFNQKTISETTNKSRIENKNDEISVTYLFYELQRRFRIKEKLHRLRPVIFVANAVPQLEEVTARWVRDHAWIIRRVLLDPEFNMPLEKAIEGVGAEVSRLNEWSTTVEQRQADVDALRLEIENEERIASESFDKLKAIAEGTLTFNDTAADVAKDAVRALAFGPFGGIGRRRRRKAKEKRIKSIKEITELEKEEAEADLQELESALTEEESALELSIKAKNEAQRALEEKQQAIARLLQHIRQNILYYMHAIWDHEPADQRFFRLQNTTVNWIQDNVDEDLIPGAGENRWGLPPIDGSLLEERKLIEVAHCDQLLGFFGNYMIFPVREPNYLHLYMMQEYINFDDGSLKDPDEFSNSSLQELVEYLSCIKKNSTESHYRQELDRILPILEGRMREGRTDDDEVIVPTESVFVQALPDKENPVLEDFKLAHRALDVKMVQAEVRQKEIENIRRGGRLFNNDFSAPGESEGGIHQNIFRDPIPDS